MTFSKELKARKSFLIILWISRAWETASELSVTDKNHHWREPSNEYRPPQRKRCYMVSSTRSQPAQQIARERQPLPSCHFSPVDFYSKRPFPTSFFSQQYCCPPSLAGLVNGFFFFCLYWICYNISSTLCFLDFWPHGMWDCSFLTRERTYPLPWKAKSEPLNHQGRSLVNGFYYSVFVSNCNSSAIPKETHFCW